MESEFDRKVASIIARDSRFDRGAYGFVSAAVEFTVSELPERRHVSAAELLEGIRKFAVRSYGAVAANVLASWGLRREDDVGTVVYLMIEVGLLRGSEEDSPEDFRTGRALMPGAPVIRSVRRKSDKLPIID